MKARSRDEGGEGCDCVSTYGKHAKKIGAERLGRIAGLTDIRVRKTVSLLVHLSVDVPQCFRNGSALAKRKRGKS